MAEMQQVFLGVVARIIAALINVCCKNRDPRSPMQEVRCLGELWKAGNRHRGAGQWGLQGNERQGTGRGVQGREGAGGCKGCKARGCCVSACMLQSMQQRREPVRSA
jgi:hypothetical protein